MDLANAKVFTKHSSSILFYQSLWPYKRTLRKDVVCTVCAILLCCIKRRGRRIWIGVIKKRLKAVFYDAIAFEWSEGIVIGDSMKLFVRLSSLEMAAKNLDKFLVRIACWNRRWRGFRCDNTNIKTIGNKTCGGYTIARVFILWQIREKRELYTNTDYACWRPTQVFTVLIFMMTDRFSTWVIITSRRKRKE